MATRPGTDVGEAPDKARPTTVRVNPAKGRPLLHWVGKRPLTRISAYPAQHIETFDPVDSLETPSTPDDLWRDWPSKYPRGGLLFHGDNADVLGHLLANGYRAKVRLVYIDPPFDSGADYVRSVTLRGEDNSNKIEGEGHSLGEQVQYTDIWANDAYLQFMFERLLLLRELLADNGTIVLHSDWQKNHHLRCLMDEVFGPENYLNEIVWYFPNKMQGNVKKFAANHNVLLWYAKERMPGRYTFHRIIEERDKPIKVNARYWDADRGMMATKRDDNGKVVYVDRVERVVDDVWGIAAVSSSASKQVGYPTQKPDELLQRVILAMSDPGDIVLDAFAGSGTTLVAAQYLGRRWIGCDINRGGRPGSCSTAGEADLRAVFSPAGGRPGDLIACRRSRRRGTTQSARLHCVASQRLRPSDSTQRSSESCLRVHGRGAYSKRCLLRRHAREEPR